MKRKVSCWDRTFRQQKIRKHTSWQNVRDESEKKNFSVPEKVEDYMLIFAQCNVQCKSRCNNVNLDVNTYSNVRDRLIAMSIFE